MGKKKNVLFICVDEWPGYLFGHAGRHDVMTPTIDFLAREGICMENSYSECPVCIPARRSLMTGLSPKSHGDRVYSDRMEMPDAPTLASVFHDAGYQTIAVGKLHVYPQRNRIGFDEALITEEGRYEFGVTDDHQIWLGEHGYTGEQFMHGMGNNTYYTRPWQLGEEAHETSWVTKMMMKEMMRHDPTRPAFFFVSYQYPHPPLVPLPAFLEKYRSVELDPSYQDDWADSWIIREMRKMASTYSEREKDEARRAFMAQCTHIDYSIRMLLGTLRELSMLDDTIIVFMSDHGDMLFDHGMVAKRLFYEGSAYIPLIFSGKPMQEYRGKGYEKKLCSIADVMPTLLSLCGIEDMPRMDGSPIFSDESREYVYGEVSEGAKATRMIRSSRYKLIYYPAGNIFQLFDMENDRKEEHDLSTDLALQPVLSRMKEELIRNLHGSDLDWIVDGELRGFDPPSSSSSPDFGLYNQRGYHWPPPGGYSNIGRNA